MIGERGRRQREELPAQDPAVAQLITTSLELASPAWDRLAEISQERIAGR
jgi:hypothetical protein